MPGPVTQMFEQSLDAVKGWFNLSALDKSAKLSNTLLTGATAVPAGRVAHLELNAETGLGEFYLGGSGTQMPIFLWQGKGDADVYNDGASPTTGISHWVAISPTGVMNGLVATGGYELQTTEFDTDLTYAINDLLSADVNGVLINGVTQYTDWICGVCSSHVNGDNQAAYFDADAVPTGPVGKNAYGAQTLTFWSYFLPAAAA